VTDFLRDVNVDDADKVAAPADAEVWTSFQRHQSKQLDYLGGIALTIAYRLGWVVLLLALLVGGCTYQSIVVVSHR
jgi:hypothetical protein